MKLTTPTIETGPWHVYRFNRSRHVLKSVETTLDIKQVGPGPLMASVELSGWDNPIEVEMLFDPTTGAWYGEEESFDFRWAPIKCGKTHLLVGYALDRCNSAYCDSFVAVKARRTVELRGQNTYSFASSHRTLPKRGKVSENWGAISVNRTGDPTEEKYTITYKGMTRKNVGVVPHERGLKVTGEWNVGTDDESRIELWILPVDQTGHLLAIGNYTGRMPASVETRPGPECNWAVHAC